MNQKTSISITITVNGQMLPLEEACSVKQLIQQLKIASPAVAVEINEDIVGREHFGRMLDDGDRVEIVTLVGGG